MWTFHQTIIKNSCHNFDEPARLLTVNISHQLRLLSITVKSKILYHFYSVTVLFIFWQCNQTFLKLKFKKDRRSVTHLNPSLKDPNIPPSEVVHVSVTEIPTQE